MFESDQSLLGATSSSASRSSRIQPKTLRKLFILGAFAVSVLMLLPLSLRAILPKSVPTSALVGIGCAAFFAVLAYAGLKMRDDNKKRRAFRQERDRDMQILDSTYKCIRPQILGSLVVFPITIKNRSAEVDTLNFLNDDSLSLSLNQGSSRTEFEGADRDKEKAKMLRKRNFDTVNRVKRIIEAVLGDDRFEVKIFEGSKGW